MKDHETRSHAHGSADEDKIMTRKQKAETRTNEAEQSPKKAKPENNNGHPIHKSAANIDAEFEEFSKAIKDLISVEQMREILEANGQDPSGSDEKVVIKCLDMLFNGALEKCLVCNGNLECTGSRYSCRGFYSEWSSCTFSTKDPPRKKEPIKLTDTVLNSPVPVLVKKYNNPNRRRRVDVYPVDKPFAGMTICLTGRLSRTHQQWKTEIEKYGGKVSNSVIGVTCLVVSPAERERGGSIKRVEAIERGIPVVTEAWLIDSIEKQDAQPQEAYDVLSDIIVEGKAVIQDSLSAELKLYGKRCVHKDSKLQERGGKIFEKDGILYNCAFSLCDLGRRVNDYCIMQLIMLPEGRLYLFYKKGRVGGDPKPEERVKEWENKGAAVKDFVQHFEEITGNEFEPWEREKKFQKKLLKFYPVDMDDGIDVRYGGLAPRQLGVAVAHCKLDPLVANFVKVLCSQEIYKYALMEMGLDLPNLPTGILSKFHLQRCEEVLQEFIEKIKSNKETGLKSEAIWSDFSQRWFTLLQSSRPFIIRDYQELADHAAAAFETVRDINVASHLVGDLTGSTLEDPLSDRYKKLGCSISPLGKDTDHYKMILNYLEKTYEPVKVGDIDYGISVDHIFSVELSACPSVDEIKKLPNTHLLWCGTRSSNLLRHLHKGFLPAISSLPVPGYMFGRAIVCSDTAAEAARYGFAAMDKPEGFLVLAVASLGPQIVESKSPPQDTKTLKERKFGVKGLGRKKTDESEHFMWEDDIKVPCGRLMASEHKDSALEYNQYAVYDPNQVNIRFVVAVKFEEMKRRAREV